MEIRNETASRHRRLAVTSARNPVVARSTSTWKENKQTWTSESESEASLMKSTGLISQSARAFRHVSASLLLFISSGDSCVFVESCSHGVVRPHGVTVISCKTTSTFLCVGEYFFFKITFIRDRGVWVRQVSVNTSLTTIYLITSVSFDT